MTETVRVVIDLDLAENVNLRTRDFAFHLVQAIEDYAQAEGLRVRVTALRIPEATQTFRQARELYDEDAFRKRQHLNSRSREGSSP